MNLPKKNLDSESTTEAREVPIESNSRVGATILQLHSKLPTKQSSHGNSQEHPCDSGKLRSAKVLEIEEPTPEDIGTSSSNT